MRELRSGVLRLLPGHWLRASRRGLEVGEWWKFPISGPTPTNGVFKSILEASVDRR